MSQFVVVLLICSCFMHAGWNLLARRKRDEVAFFSRMLILVALIGFVPATVSELLTRSLPPKAWACVAGSGVFCGFYFFFLALGYESADMTTVYPVARGLPVLMVGLGDMFRGRYPTSAGWLGMILVVCGCFLSPLESIRDVSIRRYLNRTSLWMFLTALGTVGYTMLDKIASEVVVQGPATAARYGYVFLTVSCVTYMVLLRVFKRHRRHSDAVGWWLPFLAGGLNFGAYWLVLWAYQLSRHASYIVAFRQLSIVIGVVLAFAIYKERGLVVRLAGAFTITAGLIIIGLWAR